MAETKIIMLDDDCDRCGSRAEELLPWKFSDAITFRRKLIGYPWLCRPCFWRHKNLMWRRGYA
jgi:hypothetical protein